MAINLIVRNIIKDYHLSGHVRKSLAEEVAATARRLGGKGAEKQGRFRALDDISFSASAGDTVCIIGRNGAGKSTLLRVISGITAPDQGFVEIEGHLASILEIGTGFHADLSGRENIYFSGALLGMSKTEIRAKSDEIIAFSGIEGFIDHPVKYYSDGMYMRLAFSVAAHLSADILLFDEVLATGDAVFRLKCFEKIRSLASQGKIVIIVTHNFFEIMDICNRCLLLEAGRLKSDGSPQAVIPEYLNTSYSLYVSKQHGLKHTNEDIQKAQQNDSFWKGDEGNQIVRLKEVQIKGGETRGGLCNDKDVEINIVFETLSPSVKLYPSYLLKDYTLHPVFMASPLLEKPPVPVSEPGLYKASSVIPAGMLNPGRFSLEIIFADDNKNALFSYNNAVSFNMKISGEPDDSWRNNIPGAVSPPQGWQIEKIN
jgi:lipopolysaccharide transport system ATP-binding protein